MRTLVIFAVISFSVGSSAQDAARTTLQECIAILNDAERLACFDSVIGRGEGADSIMESTQAEAETEVEIEVETETEIESDAIPTAEDTDITQPNLSAEPERAVSDAAPPTPTAPPRASADLGIEQIQGSGEDAEEQQAFRATVAEVTEGSRGHLYFHLDNGSVWRQQEARFFPYPRNGRFEVEIDRGLLGEYQLRVDGRGRMVRIRRVE